MPLLCPQQDLGLWDAGIYLTDLISSGYSLSAGCDVPQIYSAGVFGEQSFDSLSAFFHLERWLILRPIQGVAGKKPFTLQNEKELLGWYLFLSAIYWNSFDGTSSINTSGEHACMYFTERYSKDQAVIVTEFSQPNFWNEDVFKFNLSSFYG